MEKDLCFIITCDGPETPAQKLVKVTPKGYATLIAYAEAAESSTVLEHLKNHGMLKGRLHEIPL